MRGTYALFKTLTPSIIFYHPLPPLLSLSPSPSDRHSPQSRLGPRPIHSSRSLPSWRQECIRLLSPPPVPPTVTRMCARHCRGDEGAGGGAGGGAGRVHAGILWLSLASRRDSIGPGRGVGWVGWEKSGGSGWREGRKGREGSRVCMYTMRGRTELVYLYLYGYMYAYVYTSACVYTCAHVRTYTCIFIASTQAQTTPTYIRAHTCVFVWSLHMHAYYSYKLFIQTIKILIIPFITTQTVYIGAVYVSTDLYLSDHTQLYSVGTQSRA